LFSGKECFQPAIYTEDARSELHHTRVERDHDDPPLRIACGNVRWDMKRLAEVERFIGDVLREQ